MHFFINNYKKIFANVITMYYICNTLNFEIMITTTQYIECYKKPDKNGNFYYTEKWVDVEYNSETVEFKHTTVVSGKCSKQDFEQRMSRTVFLEKSENHIIYAN